MDGGRSPWPGGGHRRLERTRRKERPWQSPRPVSQDRSSFEHDPRNDPSPRVPKPLPERGRRAGVAAIAMVLAALVVVVLIVLL